MIKYYMRSNTLAGNLHAGGDEGVGGRATTTPAGGRAWRVDGGKGWRVDGGMGL